MLFYFFSSFLILSSVSVVLSKKTVHAVLSLILAFFNSAALFILLGAELLAMILIIIYVGAIAVLFLFIVMLLDVKPISSTLEVRKKTTKSKMSFAISSFLIFMRSFIIFLAFFILGTIFLYLAYKEWPELLDSTWKNNSFILIITLLGYALSKILCGLSILESGLIFIKTLPSTIFLSVLFLIEIIFLILNSTLEPLTRGGKHVLDIAVQKPTPLDISNSRALGQVIYTDYVYLFQVAGLILLIAMIGAILLTQRKRKNVKRQDSFKQSTRSKEETLDLVKIKTGSGVEF